ncbi:TPA: glycosyltransferase [Enterococcus faecium]|nr:glycosyltransferase [Enterococcus faecium]
MKILHYSLGYPPNRSGGLVKYAIDLMNEEADLNHEIFSLYPGRYNPIKKTKIKYEKTLSNGIKVFELFNSLPLPLFGGIKKPKDFYRTVSIDIYIDFFKSIDVDIIHVHTLMGLHREFFESANVLGIPIVFTSHDYFGLAPEPNFFFNGRSYDDKNTVENWALASVNSLSTSKLRLFQLKNYFLCKKLITLLKREGNYKKEELSKKIIVDNKKIEELALLKKYYSDIFSHITKFHFNSSIAKEVYQRNISKKNFIYRIIPITNSSIDFREKSYKFKHNKVRVAYIGPNKEYKGFIEFIKLSKNLDEAKFEFHTYGYEVNKNIQGIIQHGKYNNKNLRKIYSNIDVLVVPSLWKETFGFIVLEALSYNTKVLVSENVGSRDLLYKESIFSDFSDLIEKTKNYDNFEMPSLLSEEYSLRNHALSILKFYVS